LALHTRNQAQPVGEPFTILQST
jgi:hypothetical protein